MRWPPAPCSPDGSRPSMNRLLRLGLSIPFALPLYALLLLLGAISLPWNIAAMLL